MTIKTLWDEEQEKEQREQKLLVKQQLLGRKDVPAVMHGVMLKTLGSDPVKILSKGKYIKIPNGSWIRRFDKKYRYHAYILPDNNIQIHTDFIKSKHKHIASSYLGRDEKKRLREFIVLEKIEHPSKKQIALNNKRFYKKNILSKEDLRKALEKIKKEKMTFFDKLLNLFK